MVEVIFGERSSSKLDGKKIVTTYRVTARNEDTARRRAQTNAKTARLRNYEVVGVEELEDPDGQRGRIYEVEVESDR